MTDSIVAVAGETASGAPRRVTAAVWGDWLLDFGGGLAASVGRAPGEAGRVEASGADWRLRVGPRSPGWCGYPVRRLASPPWTLWVLGESYGERGASTGEPLALGVAAGRRGAHELNGHLLLLGWNESERRWHVWTDRFGTVHAYFGSAGGRAALGSFFPAVAAVASRRSLDWSALSGFFAFGFFPADRTFFDDVRILRPASHNVFDATGRPIAADRYWSWVHAPEPRRSYPGTVEEFADVLHRVLDEQATGRLAVPISGGLDSRTTVAALTRPGAASRAALWSYSYGYAPGSAETRIARQVASARDLPFESHVVGEYLFDRLPSVLSCVEGFQDVTQSRQAAIVDRLARESDAVTAAHWGDVWLDDMGLAEREAPTDAEVLDHAYQKIAKRGRRWLLDRLVTPRLDAAPEPLLREQVGDELARLPGISDPDFRVKAFKTEQWSFRWTLASIRMYQAGAFPRLPFYDTRMADFFSTVPTAFVRGRRLQIDYLKRFAPDLARIEWQAYGTNLYRYRYFDSLLLPSRAVKKMLRSLAPRVPQRNWEVQFLGAGGRRRLVEPLLSPTSRLAEFVAPRDVRSLLERFFEAPEEEGRGYTVSMLLTFAAWMEAYG